MPRRRSAGDGAADFGKYQVRRAVFLQQPRRLVGLRIANDVAGRGVGGVLRHSREFQCKRIRDGDVAINTREKHGIRGGDGVEIFARGIAAAGPEGLVPSETGDPFTRRAVI